MVLPPVVETGPDKRPQELPRGFAEMTRAEDVGMQTRERIAWKYTACQFIVWVSFEWSGNALKSLRVEGLMSGVQEMGDAGRESGKS
jgi:hypothetical protein